MRWEGNKSLVNSLHLVQKRSGALTTLTSKRTMNELWKILSSPLTKLKGITQPLRLLACFAPSPFLFSNMRLVALVCADNSLLFLGALSFCKIFSFTAWISHDRSCLPQRLWARKLSFNVECRVSQELLAQKQGEAAKCYCSGNTNNTAWTSPAGLWLLV